MLRMNFERRTHAAWSVGLAMVVAGCSDEAPTAVDRVTTSAGQGVVANDYESLDEEFARLAVEIPGGFAGMYRDSTGSLVVVLTDVSLRDSALRSLGPAVRRHTAGQHGEAMSASARVQKAEYRFDELKRWREQIERVPLTGLTMTDVNERLNRVELGFENPSAAHAAVAATLTAMDIPAQAVVLVPFAKVRVTQTLSDVFSSIPGGVQVRAGSSADCSMAASIKYNGTNAIIGSSHCSPTQGAVDGATWIQVSTLATLGSEIADRSSLCPGWSNWYPCRGSDAAIVSVNGYPIEIGKIARTKGVSFSSGTVGNDTIDTTRPRFDLLSPGYVTSSLISGDRVYRVGWKRGWVSGLINQTCATYLQNTGWYMMCNDRYAIATEEGDSGGSVFIKIACPDDPPTETNCARFAGIHWGGNTTYSYYSPVGKILSDFSSATFQFIP